jgi:hypothetical protein
MDINSLTSGSPFYVLKKGERPVLEIGTVKAKSQPRPQYQTQTPNLMNGMNFQQVVDLTVTINGSDRVINNIPLNVEIAAQGNETFSGSREAMLQAVDNMLQTSRKALDQIPFHKGVIAESEKIMEVLNPRYAEEKRQARTIKTLEERQTATDQKLDSILKILQKLDTPSPSNA